MAIKKYNADDAGKDAVPLRVIDAVQVAARPANRIISRRLSQPEGKHPPEADQWGLRWNKRSGCATTSARAGGTAGGVTGGESRTCKRLSQ